LKSIAVVRRFNDTEDFDIINEKKITRVINNNNNNNNSLVEVYQCFRGTCCLHHQGTNKMLCPDDGGSKYQ
jgi:hypothetical protein